MVLKTFQFFYSLFRYNKCNQEEKHLKFQFSGISKWRELGIETITGVFEDFSEDNIRNSSTSSNNFVLGK